MLKLKDLDNKSFERRMGEALSQLPLYTRDWTNYNASDPGVTVLENLTLLSNMQLGIIGEVSDAARFALLKMCGFETRRGKSSRVLLMGKDLKEEVTLPANKQMHLGNLCFETQRPVKVYPYRFTGVYGFYGDSFHEHMHLTEMGIEIATPVFGDAPTEGDAVYFMADGMPGPHEELIAHVRVADKEGRNPVPEKTGNIFAQFEWQVYTENGFETVNVKDKSAAFLMEGEIRIKMPDTPAAICNDTPKPGYCVRALIKHCNYDIAPRLISVLGFLFEVYQKETLSDAITSQKPGHVRLHTDMAEEGYIRVFAKESKGTSYYMYTPLFSGEEHGRYYKLTRQDFGCYDIDFMPEIYGYGPAKVKNTVKVLVYSEFMMQRYNIGKLAGYDNESIRLPVNNILPASFSLLVRRTDENGEYIYDFARPGIREEGALCYELFEKEGRIVIKDPGDYIGADLFIATVTTFSGAAGNIRPGNTFNIKEGNFTNPGKGENGCFRETLPELHARFLEDLKKPYTAVTESDYETLVKEIPQLCIKKVKAFADEEQNLVRVAVMPGTGERFPMLSDLYRSQISGYLDERRLLTTRIEIVQPVYIPVNVVGTIYIKQHFSDCENEIKEAINYQLDYINNNKNFGQTLSFNQIFHAVESLNCVEYIYDLAVRPIGAGQYAYVKDSDVYLRDNVLLYPGEISLDIGAYHTH